MSAASVTSAVPPCEVCAQEARWFAEVDSYHHYRCTACSHLFVWPRPDQASLAKVYESDSYYDRGKEEAPRLRAEAVARLSLLERLVASCGLERRLLDVGCASGLFLGEARARGWQAVGLERSSRLAQQGEAYAGTVVHVGLVEEGRVTGAPYPVVTAWEVIEHAADPVHWLSELARNVAPGGLLAISTPQSDGLPALVMGPRFPMIAPPEHLSLFSRKSLRILANRLGFAQLEFQSFSNLTAGGLASGLGRIMFGRALDDVHPALRVSLSGLAATGAWIPTLVDRLGYGTEMLFVFRKIDT